MKTYKIIRYYFDQSHPDNHKVVRTGLTLKEAQKHCENKKTRGQASNGLGVIWFDGYTEE